MLYDNQIVTSLKIVFRFHITHMGVYRTKKKTLRLWGGAGYSGDHDHGMFVARNYDVSYEEAWG